MADHLRRLAQRALLACANACMAAADRLTEPAPEWSECLDCGGPLPYGGHVATPLCDACLGGDLGRCLGEA